MALPKPIVEAKGSWQGKYLLNLPFLPPGKRVTKSATTLHIDTDRQETYATITYDWHYEGKREEGTLILCKHEKTNAVEIGWVDSWHQNGAVMHLTGETLEAGSVKTRGTYSAEGQNWGWTIEFLPSNTQLVMNMENVSPGGEAVWAVRATYERA